MDILINVIAIAFMLSLTGYAVALGVGNWKVAAVNARTADLERDLLRKRIDQITDQQRMNREKTDASWNGFRKFEIMRKNSEGGGICSFYLTPHDKKPLPPFDPGQYLTFQLPIPGQRKPIIRCYSLSDSPHHPNYYRVSIKAVPPPRDQPEAPPGLSSNFFHDSLNENDILDVKAPGGHFFLDTTKHTPVVLIGGGIGLTPVLSMLNTICESGSTREVWFFYGVRNSAEHVMKEHLEQIAAEHENVHLMVCYSNPGDDDVAGRDYQHAERVSVNLFQRVLPSSNYDFYMCGPPPMMNTLVPELAAWGVPEKNIHFEAFGPATVKKATPEKNAEEKAAAAAAAESIEVVFAKSGKTVQWDSEADSILDFAEENDIAIDFGCRAGNCGTCITAVRAGDVKYVVEPGAAPEAGSCLTCISVPRSSITLDA
jgi:ferredoxin-NADP reductase